MHTIRRYDSPLERLSEALGAFLRRRAVEAGGIVLVAGAIASALALATWSVNDPSWNNATSAPARNLLGSPGAIGADLLIQVFGLGAVAFLLGPAAWGLRLLRHKKLDRQITSQAEKKAPRPEGTSKPSAFARSSEPSRPKQRTRIPKA
ncbi:DNA translocase FtsK 4TM domain-containing protein, partial [Enterovirga sp. CN4-39]|uniref:DNA translocase FtsK 4TM domain-containing protein n=1 Tax=Enterovirga sp. CN4-39 TaxID=3400910 RepID=UPI003C03F670